MTISKKSVRASREKKFPNLGENCEKKKEDSSQIQFEGFQSQPDSNGGGQQLKWRVHRWTNTEKETTVERHHRDRWERKVAPASFFWPNFPREYGYNNGLSN